MAKGNKIVFLLIAPVLVLSLVAAIVPPSTVKAQPEPPPPFLFMWGREGTGDGEFKLPHDVAVDTLRGYVYVADSGNHRIQKFTSTGVFIRKWGRLGTGDREFSWPIGIAVDALGNVYVADTYNHRIQKFTSDGVFIRKWGRPGTGDGEFDHPLDVAVDVLGNVYVADTLNYRIQKFTSDGVFIRKWNVPAPNCVAVDAFGYVYVTSVDDHRIRKFTNARILITEWGGLGDGDGEFDLPAGIAVDALGYVYVADVHNYRIQKFTSTGAFLTNWGGFNFPYGVAVNALGHVYVTDTYKHRVQVFGFVPSKVTTEAVTNITTHSARLNGNLTSLGTATKVRVSFQWGLAPGVYPNETTPVAMTAPGAFFFDLSGLTPGTTYYFRAKTDGDIHGISFGLEKSFTTPLPPPPPRPRLPLTPATFSVGNLSFSATQVPPNYPIVVSVYVTNSSSSPGNITLTLTINGIVEQSQSVTIPGGATSQITFTVYKAEPGTYNVAIDGLQGSFTVLDKSSPAVISPGISTLLIIGIALVFAAIFLSLIALVLRRRV